MTFEGPFFMPCTLAMLLCLCVGSTIAYPFSTYTSFGNHHYNGHDAPNNHHTQYILNIKAHDRHRDSPSRAPSPVIINVHDFIHNSDHGDHTEGFEKAWAKACATENAAIVVPRGDTYNVKQLTFSGPCVSQITMQIYGTVEASTDMSDYENDGHHWIKFRNIQGLTVAGGGTINGNGAVWWRNSCKTDPSRPCKHAPNAVTFEGCNDLVVREILVTNAQQMHLTFENCENVKASDISISSPGDSPNTDGIHVTSSRNVVIQRSLIRTGDDCISIVSGSTNVKATDITCGPGHGISIGSLGKGHTEARVSNVLINRATLTGTTNGLRIKSWQGGSGYAEAITFQNVVMHNVSNPIIIDQNYCDQKSPCSQQRSAVRVNNVRYNNIRGTSNTEVAIKFDCSDSYPCHGITLQDVKLAQEGGDEAKAACKNILLRRLGQVNPHC